MYMKMGYTGTWVFFFAFLSSIVLEPNFETTFQSFVWTFFDKLISSSWTFIIFHSVTNFCLNFFRIFDLVIDICTTLRSFTYLTCLKSGTCMITVLLVQVWIDMGQLSRSVFVWTTKRSWHNGHIKLSQIVSVINLKFILVLNSNPLQNRLHFNKPCHFFTLKNVYYRASARLLKNARDSLTHLSSCQRLIFIVKCIFEEVFLLDN